MSTSPEAYPLPPWQLFGESIQTKCRIDAAAARRLVPAGLRIVRVWPHSTLGIVYCASYGSPSVLRYHELIIAPALVETRGRVGFWISHIYVDDPASRAGGRGIWSLPKQLATFSWEPQRREVAVRCGSQPLCRIRWTADAARWPVPLYLPAISRGPSAFRFFSGRGHAKVGRSRGEILIDADSPLPRIGLERARSIWLARGLRLTVGAPTELG